DDEIDRETVTDTPNNLDRCIDSTERKGVGDGAACDFDVPRLNGWRGFRAVARDGDRRGIEGQALSLEETLLRRNVDRKIRKGAAILCYLQGHASGGLRHATTCHCQSYESFQQRTS